jgi:hypothetical protein
MFMRRLFRRRQKRMECLRPVRRQSRQEVAPMVLQNMSLVGAGIACLSFSGFVLYGVLPRQGKPESAWTKTELRSTFFALTLVTTIVFGLALVVRGIVA